MFKTRVSRSGRVLKMSFKMRQLEEEMLDSGESHKLSSSFPNRKKYSELDGSSSIKLRAVQQSTSSYSSDANYLLNSCEYSDDEPAITLSPINVTGLNGGKETDPSHCAGTRRRKGIPVRVQLYRSSHSEGNGTDSSSSTTESSSDSSGERSESDPELGTENDQIHGTELSNEESVDNGRDPNGSDAHRREGQKKVLAKKRSNYERDPEYVLQEHVVNGNKRKRSSPKNQPSRLSTVTSYILWRRENKRKFEAMHGKLSYRDLSKKVNEAWRALPQAEKVLWKRRAKQLSLRSSIINGTYSNRATTMEEDMTTREQASIGVSPIDSAARLKLLGDSLSGLGMKLMNLDCEPEASGVYSVLLDSLLCSMVPLLCLTREISGLENLPEEVFLKMSDHIAYFLPGL